ncbi:hypothetical protein H5410_060130 [Solanum commersonii]|uniref:glycerophosphodiester phosphodiesterase n=1 Tax=Solanum commersonii TaxID=4109 RepID=A0A9J5W525_SOLCO|nr:hypothetical protein H5410_060130 [Solanum commersonii]
MHVPINWKILTNKSTLTWPHELEWVLCSWPLLLPPSSSLAASGNVESLVSLMLGDAPLVIARGGVSGLFPDSSYEAYTMAMETSLPNVISWCDVQLTKDGVGICFPDLKLDNASDIDVHYKNNKSEYLVNRVLMQGWFSVDFNFNDLLLSLDVAKQVKPPGLWLNIQHDNFFTQHNLSMRSYIISLSKNVLINYISPLASKYFKDHFTSKISRFGYRFPVACWWGMDTMPSHPDLGCDTSLPNVISWCDVQLTKDGVACNASDIDVHYKNNKSEYLVNRVLIQGWFSVDFNFNDLAPVTCKEFIFEPKNLMEQSIEFLANQVKPPGLWLNIQYDNFFTQHNLSMRSYIISLSKNVLINYISSPEVTFLTSIVARFNPRVTKLVFRFLGQDVEPSINQTYGFLLNNLTFIKPFASGILVPKSYIWPMDNSHYLQPYTSLVLDAHKEGLEIFASEFANDVHFPYNFSYDPTSEYLSFIDNGVFSVDGVLSDVPVTASATIDCFAHLNKNDKPRGKQFVSCDIGECCFAQSKWRLPGCTDMAYTKAVSDGADVLDCPVQMTKDGIPFCLGSINLVDKTTILQSPFSNITNTDAVLNIITGIFTFNLNWDEIKSLKLMSFLEGNVVLNMLSLLVAAISSPWSGFGFFVSLVDFLIYAKTATTLSGVMIRIEKADYLANQGFGVIASVVEALRNTGYNNQTSKKVMIQSKDSSVLKEFKKRSYELVYMIDDNIRDIEAQLYPRSRALLVHEDDFLVGKTDVVQKLQSSNLSVYVQRFNNEFVSQAWDFFSDSSVEINNYIVGAGIDGVITDFLAQLLHTEGTVVWVTSTDHCILAPLKLESLPPAEPPSPILTESDVVEPPLPPVAKIAPASNADASPIAQSSVVAGVLTCCLTILLADLTTTKLAKLSKHAPEDLLARTIPVLVELLRRIPSTDLSPSIQEAAAHCLKCVACRGEGRLAVLIGESGAIPSLLSLLLDADGSLRRVLLKCLRNSVTFAAHNREIVVRHGGLEIILNLLNICSDDLKRYLLEILSALALLREVRRTILISRGVCFLVEAARRGSMVSRCRAALAIGLLGLVKRARRTLVDSGTFSVLLELLQVGDTSTKVVAANALAIPLYADLLQGTDPMGKEIAEDVFCILAVVEENGVAII